MEFLSHLLGVLIGTLRDVVPIAAVLFGFQVFILRRPIPQLRRVLIGFLYVLVGMALFLQGLDEALFPLGELMARQLTDPEFLGVHLSATGTADWHDYYWVFLFAALIGFSTTIAEPSLIAVAMKAGEVSGGAVHPGGLRIAVAVGVAVGIALGTFRIVTGTPLHYYIIVGYVIVLIQTIYAPRMIVPLAYDSGGVTTSTVTVPLVTALGLGLAQTVPGCSPILDGFGLIAFASLFPIMAVMGYAQIGHWRAMRQRARQQEN